MPQWRLNDSIKQLWEDTIINEKKILVVDNHPVMLKLMRTLLKKEGHKVLTAEDGLSALDILKTFIPDVIFVDLVMPNISGDKLCPIIRSMPKLKDAYLVIITAIAAEEKIDIIEIGANACIAKGPFTKMPEHILSVLEQSDKKGANDLAEKVIGLEDVYERGITKELLSSKRHSEVILNNMSEGILELSFDGKIIYANPVATLLSDIAEEDLLASKFSELFDDSHRERIESLMELVDEGPQKISEDLPVTLNGKQISVNMLSLKERKRKSIIIIINDISERKRMEAQLQRAQKMEAMGTLAGGVAHDLNNVLSGLVSYPELLLRDLPQDSHLRKPILTIQKAGQKAATIVEDLLTLARRGVDINEVVNLTDIISEYLESAEYEKMKSFHPNVKVERHFETDLLNIMGSPVHLSKTVMNLVSNAAEAMPSGGEIIISTENRYIDRPIRGYDDVKEGDYTVLAISDTGVGISSAEKERIFEPFYTKKVMGRSGTGLGMAVVWGTVKDHNGYIDVQSTEGKGTTFELYFPATRKESAADKSQISIEAYMGNGETILIVDDMEEQREIASLMLKELGYSVTSVASGEEAVEYMRNNSADLLVLDMIMDPGIDGFEAYRRIIEHHPGQKAIIASGFSKTDSVKKVQKLGAGKYIKKPYTLEKIGVAVNEELKKQ